MIPEGTEASTPKKGVNCDAYATSTPLTDSPLPMKATCCFSGFFFRRKNANVKQVRFAGKQARGKSGGNSYKRTNACRSTISGGGSPSKKSFYSAVSKMTNMDEYLRSSPSTAADASKDDERDSANASCPCGFKAHVEFDARYPLVIPPNVEPGSQAELLIHAKAMVGRWVTVTERSDSLDPQMIYVGIGKMKRMVMNRLAIPLGAELTDDEQTLKVWIETPVGNKATHASLVGKETFDADGDLGDWTAKTCITDYSYACFCKGREFRSLQMERHNPKLGIAYETKAVLPDAEFGKILLYNITIHPPNNGDVISVNRVYR